MKKMIEIRTDDLREIRKYEPLVPEEYQDPDSITKIIELIKSDKAATVDEACALLG